MPSTVVVNIVCSLQHLQHNYTNSHSGTVLHDEKQWNFHIPHHTCSTDIPKCTTRKFIRRIILFMYSSCFACHQFLCHLFDPEHFSLSLDSQRSIQYILWIFRLFSNFVCSFHMRPQFHMWMSNVKWLRWYATSASILCHTIESIRCVSISVKFKYSWH